MGPLVFFVRIEIWLLLGSLIMIVAYQILTRRINTKRLLFDKETKQFSPGRVQLLMFTLIGALYYLLLLIDNQSTQLPEVPQQLLLLLGGSNIVYLGGKAFPLLVSLWRRDK